MFEEYLARRGHPEQATKYCLSFIANFRQYHKDSITRLCSLYYERGEGLQLYPPPQAKWLAQFQKGKIRDAANKAYDELLDFLADLMDRPESRSLLRQQHMRRDAYKKN